MQPIKIEPSIVCPKLPVYVKKDEVSVIGIDGEERAPWLDEMSIAELLNMLGEEWNLQQTVEHIGNY